MRTTPFTLQDPYSTNIVASNVDELLVKGVRHIRAYGERINVIAGPGIQAYGVNYILEDSCARLHTLRHPVSVRYLCRELIAYFRGSLNIHDGLVQASRIWKDVADGNGDINSNYGYYVFRQETSGNNQSGRNQYDWVVSNLKRSIQSRRALINVNQPMHKHATTKDFPCTIAIQFLVRRGALCCEVSSRSVDAVIGLPYDMAFFSFLNELVYKDLLDSEHTPVDLTLGYTMIKTSFTQIYDKTSHKADEVIRRYNSSEIPSIEMPPIAHAKHTLADIYNGTQETEVVRWIFANSE